MAGNDDELRGVEMDGKLKAGTFSSFIHLGNLGRDHG